MVDSDLEFVRVVKGRIEKIILGEVYSLLYICFLYVFVYLNKMEIYD